MQRPGCVPLARTAGGKRAPPLFCVLRRSALGKMHTAAVLICKHAPCLWHAGTLLLRANGFATTPALFHGRTTCTLHYQSFWHSRHADTGRLPAQPLSTPNPPNPTPASSPVKFSKPCRRCCRPFSFSKHDPQTASGMFRSASFHLHAPFEPVLASLPPHVSLRLFGPFPLHFSGRRAWLRPAALPPRPLYFVSPTF